MSIKSDTEYIAKTGHTIDADGNIPIKIKSKLVRCKDCIHAEREGGKLTCPYWMGYYMRGDVVVVEPEGFCSYGDDGEVANDERY